MSSGEITTFDANVRAAIHSAASPGLTWVFQALTLLGSQAVVIAVSAGAALILGIGISRVYLGVHYASDVIAGYLVATSWMAGVAVLYSRIATMKT